MISGRGAEPIANPPNGNERVAAVCFGVLAGDVGNECPVAIRFAVQDQARFVPVAFAPEPPTPSEQPEFQRHVEPRQPGGGVQFGP